MREKSPNWIQKGNWVNTEQLILSVGTILLAARAFGWIFQRIGQPRVVGEMTAGIVLGPSFFGRFFPGALPISSPHRPCLRSRL